MDKALPPGSASTTNLQLAPWKEVQLSVAVDYHMHTEHTDGTASSQHMADAAVSKGIREILFSEHVRHTSTYYSSFVQEIRALSSSDLSIRVGVETKVLDVDGTLDCSKEIADQCDAILGSVHSPPLKNDGTVSHWSDLNAEDALKLELELAMGIVTKSRAHILAHPMGMAVTRFHLQPVEQVYLLACACRESDKAIELNTRYCPNPKDWIDAVQRAGCKVSFGSDAHKTADVGSAWHLFNKGRLPSA